ncbi:hypothetical protein RDI58_000793 [Solanum bulbocastanum]|uniref:Uncharacterized protein n=1 Tax=Solanum bulbocastanum TaxID=147425 RepID=A0AAN8YPG3_SOLBU
MTGLIKSDGLLLMRISLVRVSSMLMALPNISTLLTMSKMGPRR